MTGLQTPTSVVFNPQFNLSTANDTVTFNILQGNISGDVSFGPVVGSWVTPELEELLELEPGTIPETYTFSQDFEGGSFPALNDPAQYEDGDINIDFPVVSSLFGFTPSTPIGDVLELFNIDIPDNVQDALDALQITDAQDGVDLLDSLFNVTFTDDDDGTPATNNDFIKTGGAVTGFDFNYSSEENALIIDGFYPDVVDAVFNGTSQIEASGTFTVSFVISEALDLIETIREPLNLTLAPTISSVLTYYQTLFGDELPVAFGSFDLDMTIAPDSAGSTTV
ncbi:MAG TPA: hypothetical protein V6C91_18515 [Coleofasciculaceae cyanobacterium]